MAPPTLRLAQDPEADALLAIDPRPCEGMLLYQIPLEWASGPLAAGPADGGTSLTRPSADWDPALS